MMSGRINQRETNDVSRKWEKNELPLVFAYIGMKIAMNMSSRGVL